MARSFLKFMNTVAHGVSTVHNLLCGCWTGHVATFWSWRALFYFHSGHSWGQEALVGIEFVTEFNTNVITSATEGDRGYVFTPLCLFVCLFACLPVCRISQKSCRRIRMKLSGNGCVTRTNWFNFGEDPNPINFLTWFFTIERSGQKRYVAWYFKNVFGPICSRGSGMTWQRYALDWVPFSFN